MHGTVDALGWVCEQGIVVESARGPVANLAEFVAGEPIRGSWWAHPASHEIYAALREVARSPDVARTRLVNAKVSLIHRRLWPALVRIADRLAAAGLVVVVDEHTATGAHRTKQIPFPDWVPAEDLTVACNLDLNDALGMLPDCLTLSES